MPPRRRSSRWRLDDVIRCTYACGGGKRASLQPRRQDLSRLDRELPRGLGDRSFGGLRAVVAEQQRARVGLNFAVWHDKDRALAVMKNAVGNAPEQGSLHTRLAALANDYEGCLLVVCETQQRRPHVLVDASAVGSATSPAWPANVAPCSAICWPASASAASTSSAASRSASVIPRAPRSIISARECHRQATVALRPGKSAAVCSIARRALSEPSYPMTIGWSEELKHSSFHFEVRRLWGVSGRIQTTGKDKHRARRAAYQRAGHAPQQQRAQRTVAA